MTEGAFHLRARGLRKRFLRLRGAPVDALDGVSLEIAGRETLGVLGESGSGKSTLAKVLTRLVPLDAGTIEISSGGAPWRFDTLEGARLRQERRRLQLVFQDAGRALDPRYTARRAVAEALTARNAPAAAASEWLARVGLPSHAHDRRPGSLSGGERQRVALARALAAEPRLLLLDEATASLDVEAREEVAVLIKGLQREFGFAILWISHDVGEVVAHCGRVLVMQAGRIVEELSAAALAAGAGTHPFTRALHAAAVAFGALEEPGASPHAP